MTNETTPYIILNPHNSELTAQCNAAGLLFDHHSHKAGQQVWEAATENWKDVAGQYVTIHYWPKNTHKQAEYRNDGYDSRRPLRAVPSISDSMANHPAGKGIKIKQVDATSHRSLTEAAARNEAPEKSGRTGALGTLIRFLGGDR